MASKDSFYLKHDLNARGDEKIVALLRKHGPLGYGLYWMIVEKIYEASGRLGGDLGLIAYDLRVDEAVIVSVVNDFGLFFMDDGRIGCKSADRRLAEREAISIVRSEAGMKGASSRVANARQMLNTCSAKSTRIGEERIGKERKGHTAPATAAASDFDNFWTVYPNKTGKVTAKKAWDKINPTPELVAVIMRAIATQKGGRAWQKEDGSFIPHPTTWLNGGRWDDEIEPGVKARAETAGKRCQRKGCGLTGNWIKAVSSDGKTGLCAACLEEEAVIAERK